LIKLGYYRLQIRAYVFNAARLRMAANERVEAEKILEIKRVEGEAEVMYLSWLGIARQRQAIVGGLKDSILGFSVNVPGITVKDTKDTHLFSWVLAIDFVVAGKFNKNNEYAPSDLNICPKKSIPAIDCPNQSRGASG
ncbi:hypothetical protein GIB67_011773, partial [Kingdonia uniflora]